MSDAITTLDDERPAAQSAAPTPMFPTVSRHALN